MPAPKLTADARTPADHYRTVVADRMRVIAPLIGSTTRVLDVGCVDARSTNRRFRRPRDP